MKINKAILSSETRYKKTAIRIIPSGWVFFSINQVADISGGYAFKSHEMKSEKAKYQVLKMSNIYQGILDLDRNASYLEDIDKYEQEFLLKDGDIVLTLTGTIGKRDYGYSVLLNRPESLLLNQRVCRLKVFDTHDKHYINYSLKSARFLYYFFLHGRGGTGNQANVGLMDLANLELLLPPLPEQRLISQLLCAWDHAIDKIQNVVDQIKLRNRSLARQLLTGRKRLDAFSAPWEHVALENYFDERNEIGHSNLPLLSIGESGVYPQSESSKKDTSNEDKGSYKRICPGDIGYNTMRMWQGRSAISYIEGIVSPAYTIVTPLDNADSKFFSHLFKLDEVVYKFYRNSQGLVSDTLNCKFRDFKIVRVDIPPTLDEQKAIAKIIDQGEEELRLLIRQLQFVTDQKRGLMQKLLTGEVRLKAKHKK